LSVQNCYLHFWLFFCSCPVFFSVVEYSLQAGTQAARQSTEVINSSCAYFVREIMFFGSFWSSLLWLLFLDCRHSFVNLFPFFFVWSLAFDFIFFPFLQIDRSCMMPFCSQGARDPECAAWLGKRAPSKWESTPRQRGKNANRGGAARSSMFTGFDFWKKIAPMYLPSSYMCPGQRRNVCADLSIHADATGERDSEACSDGVRHSHGSGKHIQRMTRRVSCTCSVARGSAKPRVR
jgi:hypothetical protein